MSTPNVPPPELGPPAELAFADRKEKQGWKAKLFRPATAGTIVIGLALCGLIYYLEFGNPVAGLPVPEVSYSLLPNEGRTEGVPIAIKLDQIAVFIIDDPMSGGTGASRAPQLVERLQNAVSDLKANPGKAITYVDEGGLPEIVLQNPDGTERRTLVRLTEGDLVLAGVSDGKRVARVWAERLVDSLKVVVFGEAPEFSVGTEFYNALQSVYAGARASGGSISKGSLDQAFAALTDSQHLALETIPRLEPDLVPGEAEPVSSSQ